MERTSAFKRFCKIISITVFILVLAMFVAVLGSVLLFKRGNEAPSIGRYRVTLMKNDTMGEIIPNGSLIISESVAEPATGSIVMFKNGEDNTFGIARVIAKDAKAYTLKADMVDNEVTAQKGIAFEKVVYASHKAGRVLSFAMSYKGVFVFAIIPCGLLILFEFILSLGGKKKEKAEETLGDVKEEETAEAFETEDKAEDKAGEGTATSEETAQNSGEKLSSKVQQDGGDSNSSLKKRNKKKRNRDKLSVLMDEKGKGETDFDEPSEGPILDKDSAKALFEEKKEEPTEKKEDYKEPKTAKKTDKEKVDEILDEVLG